MSYAGLVPKEYSSGATRWQGSITKVGNAHIRHVIVESAWAYRHSPSLKGQIRARQRILARRQNPVRRTLMLNYALGND